MSASLPGTWTGTDTPGEIRPGKATAEQCEDGMSGRVPRKQEAALRHLPPSFPLTGKVCSKLMLPVVGAELGASSPSALALLGMAVVLLEPYQQPEHAEVIKGASRSVFTRGGRRRGHHGLTVDVRLHVGRGVRLAAPPIHGRAGGQHAGVRGRVGRLEGQQQHVQPAAGGSDACFRRSKGPTCTGKLALMLKLGMAGRL